MDAVTGLPIAIEPHGDTGAGTGPGRVRSQAWRPPHGTQPARPLPAWPRPLAAPPSRTTPRAPPRPAPRAHLQTSVAMMTHQAVQQQSASRRSSLLRRRQHSQKE